MDYCVLVRLMRLECSRAALEKTAAMCVTTLDVSSCWLNMNFDTTARTARADRPALAHDPPRAVLEFCADGLFCLECSG